MAQRLVFCSECLTAQYVVVSEGLPHVANGCCCHCGGVWGKTAWPHQDSAEIQQDLTARGMGSSDAFRMASTAIEAGHSLRVQAFQATANPWA